MNLVTAALVSERLATPSPIAAVGCRGSDVTGVTPRAYGERSARKRGGQRREPDSCDHAGGLTIK